MTEATAAGRTSPGGLVSDRAGRLEELLTDDELADRVEMVLRPLGDDTYRAASTSGFVEFRRDVDGDRWAYRVSRSGGTDPLACQRTDHLIGHEVERRAGHPERTANAYPHAFDSIGQFFDAAHSPDLLALHTASHHTDDHLGQHGSLGIVQARAPFIAAGAGVRDLGSVARSTRVVNVAPTIAALLGLEPVPDGVGATGSVRDDALLRRQDGEVDHDLLDGTVARHVVVFLLDGCNANLLHDVIAAGEAPHISALVGRGTEYVHGSFASLPTATLANHTTALTGAHPGHSGVLHNTWVDRRDGSVPDLLAMDQMFWAMRHLSPDVETLFQALQRNRPGAFSSATFEFCDSGADFSSFGLVREGSGAALPSIDDVDHVDRGCAERSDAYRFMSTVDHLSAAHTIDCWSGVHGNPLPALSWCSLAVTDEAGHESGPHGDLARAAVRDSDARVGAVLAEVERRGVLDDTAVLVIADHGMEQNDPRNDRPWDAGSTLSEVPHREVGGGCFYLDPG